MVWDMSWYLYNQLKADRPHLCNYSQMPTDYRHTKELTLTPTFDLELDPDLWPWPWSNVTVMSKYDMTLTFDLWPWPTIPTKPRSRSTYISNIKVVGQMVQAWGCWRTDRRTDGWTDRHYQVHYLDNECPIWFALAPSIPFYQNLVIWPIA